MDKKYEKMTWRNLKFAESECERLEKQSSQTSREHQEISKQMKATANHLAAIQHQLQQMSTRGGAILFPRPILGDPSSASTTLCMINACPVCGLWFKCFNFIPAPCGHTYHLWCIAEYALAGSACVFPS